MHCGEKYSPLFIINVFARVETSSPVTDHQIRPSFTVHLWGKFHKRTMVSTGEKFYIYFFKAGSIVKFKNAFSNYQLSASGNCTLNQ